jgi:FlaA1/EpsC-like NDP-sugar epimerase
MKKIVRVALLIVMDIICINMAYVVALLLRFEFNVFSDQFNHYLGVYVTNVMIITLIKVAVFAAFGLYNSLWRFAGTEEIFKVVLASLGAFALVFLYLDLTAQVIPRGVQGICFLLDIIFLGGTRMSYRSLRTLRHYGFWSILPGRKRPTGNDRVKRVLLVGGGSAGASMIKELRDNPQAGKEIVGVIDDDPSKFGKRIVGKKILGGRDIIVKEVERLGIDEIFIAIPSASRNDIQTMVNECNKTGCRLKILPAYIDLIDGKVSISKLRDVQIEDLLGREAVSVDLREISSYLEGKIVLVTGGGGSIGSELCRQIAVFKPRKLVALDIYENTIFDLSNEMSAKYKDLEFETVIASIRDKARLTDIFDKYRPHVVFHAAAHKHVPLMEFNPKEAVLNNILGTKNVIDLSNRFAVEKFVLISTDKAVNPTNVMGATKRVAEMLMQDKSYRSQTRYSAVRFGNVLGSNGSVLPVFRQQIENGGPVTVTHPEITRYFMTIPEAVQLVIQAGAMAKGGEIFILDMGEPVKIMDLAENVIRLSGYVPHVDIEIVVTGLRPGEKLFEELLLDEEGIQKTTHDHIYVGQPVPPTPLLSQLLEQGEDALETEARSICAGSDSDVIRFLHEIVPNYGNGNGNGNGNVATDKEAGHERQETTEA